MSTITRPTTLETIDLTDVPNRYQYDARILLTTGTAYIEYRRRGVKITPHLTVDPSPIGARRDGYTVTFVEQIVEEERS